MPSFLKDRANTEKFRAEQQKSNQSNAFYTLTKFQPSPKQNQHRNSSQATQQRNKQQSTKQLSQKQNQSSSIKKTTKNDDPRKTKGNSHNQLDFSNVHWVVRLLLFFNLPGLILAQNEYDVLIKPYGFLDDKDICPINLDVQNVFTQQSTIDEVPEFIARAIEITESFKYVTGFEESLEQNMNQFEKDLAVEEQEVEILEDLPNKPVGYLRHLNKNKFARYEFFAEHTKSIEKKIEYKLKQASIAEEFNEPEYAKTLLDEAFRLDKNHIETNQKLGDYHAKQHQPDLVVKYYENVLQSDSAEIDYYQAFSKYYQAMLKAHSIKEENVFDSDENTKKVMRPISKFYQKIIQDKLFMEGYRITIAYTLATNSMPSINKFERAYLGGRYFNDYNKIIDYLFYILLDPNFFSIQNISKIGVTIYPMSIIIFNLRLVYKLIIDKNVDRLIKQFKKNGIELGLKDTDYRKFLSLDSESCFRNMARGYYFKLIIKQEVVEIGNKLYHKNDLMEALVKELKEHHYPVRLNEQFEIVPSESFKDDKKNRDSTGFMKSNIFTNFRKFLQEVPSSVCFEIEYTQIKNNLNQLSNHFEGLNINVDGFKLKISVADTVKLTLIHPIQIFEDNKLSKIKLNRNFYQKIFETITKNFFGPNAISKNNNEIIIDLTKLDKSKGINTIRGGDGGKVLIMQLYRQQIKHIIGQEFEDINKSIIQEATQQNNFIKKKGDIKLASENFSEKAIKEKIVSIKKELKQKKEKTIEQNKSIEKEIIYYQGVKDHIAVDLNEKYTAYGIVNNVLNPLDEKKSNIEKNLEKFEFNRKTEKKFRKKIQGAHENFKNKIEKAVKDHNEQLLTNAINSATNSIKKIKLSYQIEVQEELELVSGDLLKKIGNNPLIKQAISTYNQKLTQAADDSENGSSESDEELENDEEIESQTSDEVTYSNSTSVESQSSSTEESFPSSSENADNPDKTKTQNSNNNNNNTPVAFKQSERYLAFVGKNKVGFEYDQTGELDILTILEIDRNYLSNLLLGKSDSDFPNCFVEVMKAWLIEHKDELDKFDYLVSTDIEEAIKNEDDEELEQLIKDDLKVSFALLHARKYFPIHPKIALWVAAQKGNPIAIWQERAPGAIRLEAIEQVHNFNEQTHYFCNQHNQYFKLVETDAPELIQRRSSPISSTAQPKINNQQLDQLRVSIRNYFNKLKALQQNNGSVEDKLLYSFLFARASGEFLSAYNKKKFHVFEKETPEFLTLANKLIHTAPFIEPKNIENQLNVFIKNIITTFENQTFPTLEMFQQNLHGIQVLDSVLSKELAEPWQAYQNKQTNKAYQNRINEKMESRKSAWDVMILGEYYQSLAKQAGLTVTDNDLSITEKQHIQSVVIEDLNFDENTQNLLLDAYLARNQVAHDFELNAEQRLAPLKTEEQQQLSLVNK